VRRKKYDRIAREALNGIPAFQRTDKSTGEYRQRMQHLQPARLKRGEDNHPFIAKTSRLALELSEPIDESCHNSTAIATVVKLDVDKETKRHETTFRVSYLDDCGRHRPSCCENWKVCPFDT
jgi:hypothetical protein